PTTGPHTGVAVALVDGGAHHLGDVAAVVGDRGDVDAVVGQDLHEGAGQDGPDGLGDRHRPGARRLAHAALAPKPALVDADDDGAVDFCPAAADQVHQGVEAVGGEGLVAALGAGLLEDLVGLGPERSLDAGALRGGGLALEAAGAIGVGARAVEALAVDAGVAGPLAF